MSSNILKVMKGVAGALACLPMLAMAQAAETERSGPDYQLLLAGGALSVCSSMAANNCDEGGWIDNEVMRVDRYINLSDKYTKPLLDDDYWPIHRRETRDEVRDGLQIIRERINEDIMPERVFVREFTRRATQYLYENLSDSEWNLILDHLEMPVAAGMFEQVNVAESLNKEAVGVFEEFVAQAAKVRGTVPGGDDKPRIAVITASARDPYDAVDFYVNLFAELGAEAQWLPIDAAVYEAQRSGKCDAINEIREEEFGAWDRSRVHAEKYQQQVEFCKRAGAGIEMIENVDAVFINGGDQNLTRKALLNPLSQPSPLLTEIYSRVSSGNFVVGGTSAGTAVMTAKSMITNGTSAEALKAGARAAEPPVPGCNNNDSCPRDMNQDTLTYHPLGGIGLFPYAILDTHFSERGRQARLLRLAAETFTPMAIGVDETTALQVNVLRNEFRVIGERGVFFAVGAQQADNAVASTFHYLTSGASGRISDQDINAVRFATDGKIIQAEPTTRFLDDRGMIDSMRLLCRDRKQFNLLQGEYRLTVLADDNTRSQVSGGECQVMNGRVGIALETPEKF
ncbi:cyanophycinase [Pseudidiomarina aestuarii]|uniref:Cyanophycinase n=1 Tax=Pseudidiomarina aestuarii TaxID=624146 RepID=A0A6N4DIY6_9GAMM|nr:cyanophycinase [Pseudidiomarina aestuarii]